MVPGQVAEQPQAGLWLPAGSERLLLAQQVAVAELHPFRETTGPGGVHDQREALRLDAAQCSLDAPSLFRRRLRLQQLIEPIKAAAPSSESSKRGGVRLR